MVGEGSAGWVTAAVAALPSTQAPHPVGEATRLGWEEGTAQDVDLHVPPRAVFAGTLVEEDCTTASPHTSSVPRGAGGRVKRRV